MYDWAFIDNSFVVFHFFFILHICKYVHFIYSFLCVCVALALAYLARPKHITHTHRWLRTFTSARGAGGQGVGWGGGGGFGGFNLAQVSHVSQVCLHSLAIYMLYSSNLIANVPLVAK